MAKRPKCGGNGWLSGMAAQNGSGMAEYSLQDASECCAELYDRYATAPLCGKISTAAGGIGTRGCVTWRVAPLSLFTVGQLLQHGLIRDVDDRPARRQRTAPLQVGNSIVQRPRGDTQGVRQHLLRNSRHQRCTGGAGQIKQ